MYANPGRHSAAVAAGGLVGLVSIALWVVTAAHEGTVLYWPKLADDGFYYFEVARNIVEGRGSSLDGLHPTNGYHPLWLMCCMGLWAVTGTTLDMVAAVHVAGLVFAVVFTVLIVRLMGRDLALLAAVAASSIVIFPRYFNLFSDGLESGLLMVSVTILLVVLRSRHAAGATWTAGADVALGVAAGVVTLARLDAGLVGPCAAAYVAGAELWQRRGGRHAAARGAAVLLPWMAMLGSYLAMNVLAFGRIVPISGALKSANGELGAGMHALSTFPEYLGLLVPAALGVAVGYRRFPGLAAAIAVVTAANIAHAAHTLLLMKWAIFEWHFAAYLPPAVLGIGILVDTATRRLPRRLAWGVAAGVAAVLIVLLTFSAFKPDTRFIRAAAEGAQWAHAHLPTDARIAMKDCGAFAFLSERDTSNLDGIISDMRYQCALCEGRLVEHLRETGVDYIVQHSVAAPPGYGTTAVRYPCHLPDGADSLMEFREQDEVFVGQPYSDDGALVRLVIWRTPWADQ